MKGKIIKRTFQAFTAWRISLSARKPEGVDCCRTGSLPSWKLWGPQCFRFLGCIPLGVSLIYLKGTVRHRFHRAEQQYCFLLLELRRKLRCCHARQSLSKYDRDCCHCFFLLSPRSLGKSHRHPLQEEVFESLGFRLNIGVDEHQDCQAGLKIGRIHKAR